MVNKNHFVHPVPESARLKGFQVGHATANQHIFPIYVYHFFQISIAHKDYILIQ